MSVIKRLAGQTLTYGVSSVAARFLNFFLLTPFYTSIFPEDQFGVITEMYAFVAFLIVLLTYGMETAFFRYSTKEEVNSKTVYSNALYSLFFTTSIFLLLATAFSVNIAEWLLYPDHQEYVIWFAAIIGLDALSAIPLAKLRKEGRAKKFAMVNVINVLVNIGLNLFFLLYCKSQYDAGNSNWLIDLVYNPEIGVGYVFICNLVASAIKFLILLPEMSFGGKFDWKLLKHMLNYAYPMLFVGLAGIVNEMLDRSILKPMLTRQYLQEGTYDSFQMANKAALAQLGIYGGNYKITMIISLFIQAYKYAAEPFFFNQEKEKDAKKTYANVMNYFVIIVTIMFLAMTMNLQIIKYFTPQVSYWEGLKVVPILLAANVFLGIYVNQSTWYKLSSKTKYGALIGLIGVAITIAINIAFIPLYGYMACAWGTFICYGTMLLISYFLGKRHYPIPYNIKKILFFIGLAALLFFIRIPVDPFSNFSIVEFLYNNCLVLLFIGAVVLFDPTIKQRAKYLFSKK